uniref:ASH1L n=1 Tax=Xiphophorus couchianus TaxID=32473 RepID=A0A3B5MP01_9TELE
SSPLSFGFIFTQLKSEGQERDLPSLSGNAVKKEEEKRGPGGKREGDKGAVLELLIEGRCGGQQELQLSGRESNCPEGNVRVRIGLQAKRTKKPPKILESYVCKPTIRTYQRQGRGALLRIKSSPATDEANREQRSGLDAVQATSKKTTSATPPPLAKSLSSSSSQPLSISSTLTSESTPASAPNISSQGTKTGKQVGHSASQLLAVNLLLTLALNRRTATKAFSE